MSEDEIAALAERVRSLEARVADLEAERSQRVDADRATWLKFYDKGYPPPAE